MSKRLVHEMAYDAPAEKVLAMLADPAFREEVCDHQRVLRREVTVETTGDGFDVTIDQYQAAQGIPSFAKKFVGDEINIVQTESWHGPTGDVTVTIPGKPGDRRPDDQGQHPAGRRQDRGPDRRPAAQGAQGRAQGRSGVPRPLTGPACMGTCSPDTSPDGCSDLVVGGSLSRTCHSTTGPVC